jgi:15-cis-phytoene synthase
LNETSGLKTSSRGNAVLSGPDFDAVRAAARDLEPDRHLAALLSPEPQRTALLAIAAFSAELRHIPRVVTDPMIGEIRLQWWRDGIEAFAPDVKTGNPIADTLGDAVRRYALPPATLIAMTEARAFDLYADPMPDAASLYGYLAKTEGVPFELAFRVLAGRAPEAHEITTLGVCARAYGLTRLIGDLPQNLAHGCCPLPMPDGKTGGTLRDQMRRGDTSQAVTVLIEQLCNEARSAYNAAQAQVVQWPRPMCLAVRPLAVVPAYLRAATSQSRNPLREPVDIAPLTRVWRIARGPLSL